MATFLLLSSQLFGALNSSGQYALSSGIINSDLVAQGAGRLWPRGTAPNPTTMGSPLSASAQRSPGGHPPGGTGPRGLSAGAE